MLSRRHFVSAACAVAGSTFDPSATVDAKSPGDLAHAGIFDVREFGARGDGKTFDTGAIQHAIDACESAGGGTVLLRAGSFLTRSIRLKSNVTFCIEAGAVLLGTANVEDYAEVFPDYQGYTYSNRALVYAERADNVSMTGKGAIDLQGSRFPAQVKGDPTRKGGAMEWGQSPYAVRLIECRNLTLRDITIRNCPMAALRIVASQNVVVNAVRIDNRVRISCDGIEIVSCQDVCLSDCRVYSWDDGICVKSNSLAKCRNITISNCVVSSLCNAIKLGTESNGGFENITISNCTIEGAELNGWRSINGLALMVVDGGVMDGIQVSNLVMRGVRTALFVHLGNRARPYKEGIPILGIGVLKNVSISNIFADVVDGDYCCSVTGMPGYRLENIALDNIAIRHPGGGKAGSSPVDVRELPKAYPESIMFGPLPAYGFYCRHVRGLTMNNVRLETATPEERSAIVCDDVEDFSLSGLLAANTGGVPLVQLINCQSALLQASRPRCEVFLSIDGSESTDVGLLSNDLRGVRSVGKKGADFTGKIVEAGGLRQAG